MSNNGISHIFKCTLLANLTRIFKIDKSNQIWFWILVGCNQSMNMLTSRLHAHISFSSQKGLISTCAKMQILAEIICCPIWIIQSVLLDAEFTHFFRVCVRSLAFFVKSVSKLYLQVDLNCQNRHLVSYRRVPGSIPGRGSNEFCSPIFWLGSPSVPLEFPMLANAQPSSFGPLSTYF